MILLTDQAPRIVNIRGQARYKIKIQISKGRALISIKVQYPPSRAKRAQEKENYSNKCLIRFLKEKITRRHVMTQDIPCKKKNITNNTLRESKRHFHECTLKIPLVLRVLRAIIQSKNNLKAAFANQWSKRI